MVRLRELSWRVARQVRTVTNALEARYAGLNVQADSKHFAWIVRHASWLITRYLIKADGKTPYERLFGRDYKGEVVEPFEVVHYKVESPEKNKRADCCWSLAGKEPSIRRAPDRDPTGDQEMSLMFPKTGGEAMGSSHFRELPWSALAA